VGLSRDHLAEALGHAQRAYMFAPGSYTFQAMTALWHAAKAREAREAVWITEFIDYGCGCSDNHGGPNGTR
jgi:hypothetical protein